MTDRRDDNYNQPDILAMIADPDVPEDEIARALWTSLGYLPDDGTEFTRSYNDGARKARWAIERRAFGLTPTSDDQEDDKP